MSMLSADEIIIESLKNQGIKYLFGSPGDDELSILDCLYRDGSIKLFDTRHENTGVLAAIGYSQATGEPAVCTGTVGPGLANMFNGIYCAWRSHAPVISIVCKHAPGLWERHFIKSFDQSAAFRPITKWVIDVDRMEHIADALQRAFRVASTPPTGPVLVCINENLLQWYGGPRLDIELPPKEQYLASSVLTWTDPALAERAARLLVEAKMPLLLADDRTFWNNSEGALAELADLLAAPVFQSGHSFRPVISEDSPLSWGFLGSAACSRALELRDTGDLLLAVDCSFDSGLTTSGGPERETGWVPGRFPKQIIQIDSDSHFIAKFYPTTLGILGHSKAVLGQIIQEVKRLGINNELKQRRLQMLQQYKDEWITSVNRSLESISDKTPISPLTLAREMSDLMGSDDLLSVGGADISTCFRTLGVFVARTPRTMVATGYEGSLGQTVARAIGLKLASPEKRVTAVCGDGEFWYGNASELETLKRHSVPITIVISNNGAFGNMLNRQKRTLDERFIGTRISNPDFSQLADSFDMHSERVVKPDELAPALKRAWQSGRPALVDVHTDPFASSLVGRFASG